MIVAEAVAPLSCEPAWQEWEPLLFSQGYHFVLFDTVNRFYVAQEHPEIMARLPSERASWHAVRHMYEIGRAPETRSIPITRWRKTCARIMGASALSRHRAHHVAVESRPPKCRAREFAALASTVDTEAFRAALGRVACGYDGGQIVDE